MDQMGKSASVKRPYQLDPAVHRFFLPADKIAMNKWQVLSEWLSRQRNESINVSTAINGGTFCFYLNKWQLCHRNAFIQLALEDITQMASAGRGPNI